MAQIGRPGLSASQKAELWQRWKAGQSLSDIGRALGKHAGSPLRIAGAYHAPIGQRIHLSGCSDWWGHFSCAMFSLNLSPKLRQHQTTMHLVVSRQKLNRLDVILLQDAVDVMRKKLFHERNLAK